jgi:hypothetical protein
MSDTTNSCCSSKGVPGWFASGLLGLIIGAGGTLLAVYEGPLGNYKNGMLKPDPSAPPPAPPMMGGGGGGAGGGGGGGAAAAGKRTLTTLVGKLELLSRPDLNLHIQLDAEQSKAIAEKLAEFEKAESMSGEQAGENATALESLLTDAQKAIIASIGLPQNRPAGGGGAGGGAPAGGPPPAPASHGGPPAPPNPDENPFSQETNKKRLQDLLGRL